MPRRPADASAHPVSVRPSRLMTWMLGGPAAAICLLPPLLATMTTDTRFLWVAIAALFVLMGLAVERNRITVSDDTLYVRYVTGTKQHHLDSLTAVRVIKAAGRYNSYWEMHLRDATGRWTVLRLNGYSKASRQILMSALRPYFERPAVTLEGPVGKALAGGLWFPKGRSPESGA